MILLAFDCDGVFDCGTPKGPLSREVIERIVAIPSVAVCVVSDSLNYSWSGVPRIASNVRRANLSAFRDQFPAAMIRLYVSDNKDYAEADAAGFTYIEASEFAKGT